MRLKVLGCSREGQAAFLKQNPSGQIRTQAVLFAPAEYSVFAQDFTFSFYATVMTTFPFLCPAST